MSLEREAVGDFFRGAVNYLHGYKPIKLRICCDYYYFKEGVGSLQKVFWKDSVGVSTGTRLWRSAERASYEHLFKDRES